MDPPALNILSICTGAGGLDLGVRVAIPNARTVCCVEHEAYACEVLAARMEDQVLDDAPIWTDLGTFDGRAWRGLVDGLIGGIPCQPHSLAGKRLGELDPRDLWPAASRIVAEVVPEFVFLENVCGAVGFFGRRVIPDLERMGYRVAAGLFTAAEVGASHKRERLFVLALADAHGDRGIQRARAELQASGAGLHGAPVAHATGFGEREPHDAPGSVARAWPRQNAGGGIGNLGDAPGGQNDGRGSRALESETGTGASGHGAAGDAGSDVAHATAVLGGTLQRCQPDGVLPADAAFDLSLFAPGPGDFDAWERCLAFDPALEPALCRMADGLAPGLDANRLRLAGNGVVPLAAAYAFVSLWAALEYGDASGG